MNKLFFDHLLNLNRLEQRLNQLELVETQVAELREEVDELIQHRVIEVVLDNLSQSEHHTFIAWIHTNPGDSLLFEWLKSKIQNVEEIIITAIAATEEELILELFSEK